MQNYIYELLRNRLSKFYLVVFGNLLLQRVLELILFSLANYLEYLLGARLCGPKVKPA